LRVAQIEAARFVRTRLVVLGACSSGIGKTHRGEGVLSLARAFMSASVPSVVGTVAPVEDATAARLLTSFHAAYARGLDPASALRHAQLAMLRSHDRSFADPARWSAFQAIGGACASANQREEKNQWAFR
jgi:CHAT domain-containing protein